MANIFKPSASGSSSASSGTGKNYLGTVNSVNGNGDFELGTTSGWSLGTATLTNNLPTGVPTFGSGASGNLAFTATSSGKLAGTYSGQYASSAASTAGNFLASDAFSIDLEDQAKVMTFKLYYSATVGTTTANWSGSTSNSFGLAIYDVTNSAWIIPAGGFGMTQSSGVGYVTGTFQTTSNSTQYRLVMYNANATSGAITLLVDDFFLGPQTAPFGPIVTDWTAYTPTFTGFGTATSVAFVSRRVGDTLEVNGKFVSGTTTATANQITIGFAGSNANVSMDTGKITASNLVGDAATSTAATTTLFRFGVLAPPSSTTYVQISNQTSANPLATPLRNASGLGIVSGDTVQISFAVPIVGWSSNLQMSNDTDTRVVAMRTQGATATISGSYASLIWTSTVSDTHGGMGSTQYIVPSSGFYDFAAQNIINGTLALNSTVNIQVTKNGSAVQESGIVAGGAITGSVPIQVNVDAVSCNAGDTISIQAKSSALTPAVVSSTADNFFTAARRSGPAVVASTETVAARYTTAAGQSITNGLVAATAAIINFDTKDYDTHNAVATGASWTFTAPVSGKYSIASVVDYVAATFTQANAVRLALWKNGVEFTRIGNTTVGFTGSADYTMSGSAVLALNAGDTINLRTFHSESTARSLASTALLVHVEIIRVGN